MKRRSLFFFAALLALTCVLACDAPSSDAPASTPSTQSPAPTSTAAPTGTATEAPAPSEVSSASEDAPASDRAVPTSPEEAVTRFIEAQRKGDNDELKLILYPPTSPYRFRGPAVISSFEIQKREVLTEEDAQEIRDPPPRLAGDHALTVWEEYAGGRTSRNVYYVREFPEGWKIVALKIEV